MRHTLFNGKTWPALIGLAIVLGSVFYSAYLSRKLDAAVKQRVETWVEAQRTLLTVAEGPALDLAIKISSENTDIPIIETNENDRPTGNFKNIDSLKAAADTAYLRRRVSELARQHAPFTLQVSTQPPLINKYYYGNTRLQTELKYFPIIQLLIIAFFVALLVFNQRQVNKNKQNRLWIGMAKETAHQLGTPITSLSGWVELLKADAATALTGSEMEKDITRLQLISDRFSKIGSKPPLENQDVVAAIQKMVAYMRRIAGERITFKVHADQPAIEARISPPLFDWVIENLLKNALDALDHKGMITVTIKTVANKVLIEVTDTGKGIPAQSFKQVFEPGYTTKKRGWGLGLALTRRIVEEYHNGRIYVRHSEPGKGTTFRIELNRDE